MWLRLRWLDGHTEWVDHRALHVRPHWHLRMIAFYESRARKPARHADPEQDEGHPAEPGAAAAAAEPEP
jgi:hypothetical protein